MSFYRKKPVVVEAIRLTNDNFEDVRDFVYKRAWSWVLKRNPVSGDLFIPTLEGEMRLDIGSWLIRGTHGEFYPCKNAVFLEVYEPFYGPVDEQGTS